MLFIVYAILLVGGMFVMGISFSLPGLQALVFIVGLLMSVAAIGVPIAAGANEHRR
ncbi:hypothetical protein [Microbacterium sp. BK668]|uniref:hypothetical protein n=1 Tax=Microbacterium sp. BK668 TaxID=2512118 RepID=UPI0010ECD8AF|nr:hypothetical protein [Microbacterium sp. BK668]TDN91758.1 hypothetical protein EV279_1263 [Microbacterium sp. BK668]